MKSFEGALVPREIIEAVYFADELAAINELMERSATLEAELDEIEGRTAKSRVAVMAALERMGYKW